MVQSNERSDPSGSAPELRHLPLWEVDDSERMFRSTPQMRFATLLISMQRVGQQVPIKVVTASGPYKILDGIRRTRVAKTLGWRTIRAEVYPEMTRTAARRIAFVANFVRPDLTEADKIEVARLAQREGIDLAEIATMLDIDAAELSRKLMIPPEAERERGDAAGD